MRFEICEHGIQPSFAVHSRTSSERTRCGFDGFIISIVWN